jgi:hypothetical protein
MVGDAKGKLLNIPSAGACRAIVEHAPGVAQQLFDGGGRRVDQGHHAADLDGVVL